MTVLMICSECIGNPEFSNWIESTGIPGFCQVNLDHSGERNVVTVIDLAKKVDEWFRENYGFGENDTWYDESDRKNIEQRGDSYENIMIEELACEEEVFLSFQDHLPDVSDRDIAQGGDVFYDDSARYESIVEAAKRDEAADREYWYEHLLTFQWQNFCEAAKHRRRFFGLQKHLDSLFGDPSAFETGTICPIYTLPSGLEIFRARHLDGEELRGRIEENPASELGAPPKGRASAGRMNVEFIPAFYAAFSEETAIAEIRPGIGELVAIGKFELQKPLKVFDFTVFYRHFLKSGQALVSHTRYDFIDKIEEEISRPIIASDKQRDYIPTQIVAEYIGECFGCDAIIYRSSMIRGRDKDGRNIVLLNKGVPFEGAGDNPLIYRSHSLKGVIDVTYFITDYNVI